MSHPKAKSAHLLQKESRQYNALVRTDAFSSRTYIDSKILCNNSDENRSRHKKSDVVDCLIIFISISWSFNTHQRVLQRFLKYHFLKTCQKLFSIEKQKLKLSSLFILIWSYNAITIRQYQKLVYLLKL